MNKHKRSKNVVLGIIPKIVSAAIFLFICFAPSVAYSYTIENNRGEKNELNIQSKTISGNVVDEYGAPVVGAVVLIKGTENAVFSDVDGNYSIVASSSDKLLVQCLGMKTIEIAVDDQTQINVIMEADAIGLDEVVAIGYGSMRKSDLTGSVVSIKTEELTERSTISIEKAIQGRVTGVQVKTTSAAPGGGSSIVIRGGNSIKSGIAPLYVVDGFPMSQSDASMINPQDVSSIEILKDGSSTAIYGSRGANGVVLITTKKGTAKSITLTYSGYGEMQVPYNTYDFVSARDFAMLYDESQVTKGLPIYFDGSDEEHPSIDQLGEGTDWFDQLTSTGYTQNHQISVTGGTSKSSYRFSGDYFSQTGILKYDDFTRGSLSAAIDSEVTDWLKTGFNLTAYKHSKNIQSNSLFFLRMFSFIPPYNSNGEENFNYFPDEQMNSEYPLSYVRDRDNLSVSNKTNGSLYAEIKLLPGLIFKTTFGGFRSSSSNSKYLPRTTSEGAISEGKASITNSNSMRYLNENIITYKNSFDDVHRLNLMGAYTKQSETYSSSMASGSGFVSDKYLYNNLGAAETPGIPSSSKTGSQLLSYLGRVNYVYNDKYLLTVTGRADGSSKFGADNKWAFFPSVAFAWRASEEKFIKDSDNVDYLKFRVSYGETGNSNIGLYQSQGLLVSDNYVSGTGGYDGDTRVVGVVANRVPNPNLKWETTGQFDLGVDVGLFDSRVNIATDFYYKNTSDLLLDVNINSTSGYTNALRNVGSLRNVGFEISATVKAIDKDFKWDITANYSMNRNEITKLPSGTITLQSGYKDMQVVLREGYAVGQIKGPAVIGVFDDQAQIDAYVNEDGELLQPTAKPGYIQYRDVNGDGVIDESSDWEIICDTNADFIYSFGSNMSWNRFSLDLLFNGVYGNQIFNTTSRAAAQSDNLRNNLSTKLLDRWTETNTDGAYPRLGSPGVMPEIESGSYLKLSNLKFNYKVPGRLFNNVTDLNIYFSAQNLFTITRYTGFDPDINTQGSSNINFGADSGSYPNPRSYSIGLTLSLNKK